jgi:hypothetical protein
MQCLDPPLNPRSEDIRRVAAPHQLGQQLIGAELAQVGLKVGPGRGAGPSTLED